MVPEAAVAFLACARVGAVHSVVFAGFSAESLRDRIIDCKAKVVITTDEGKRGGKTIATKSIVDAAVAECGDLVTNVLVVQRTGNKVNMKEGRDLWWGEQLASAKPYCTPTAVGSEDPLFILYTSVSSPSTFVWCCSDGSTVYREVPESQKVLCTPQLVTCSALL